MPTLTDHQTAHIIELLEQGADLPLDYKHLLFPPERQEYELTYAGKEPNEDNRWAVLITVYRPDPERWMNWRTRRPKDDAI